MAYQELSFHREDGLDNNGAPRGTDVVRHVDEHRPRTNARACEFCRRKKVRCNGGSPCTQCVDRGEPCIRKPRRRRIDNQNLGVSNASGPLPRTVSEIDKRVSVFAADVSDRDVELNSTTRDNGELEHDPGFEMPSFGPANTTTIDNGICSISVLSPKEEEASGICPAELSNSEYHGPRCVFSICSLPGIAWVNEKIKVHGFQESAYRYSKDITRRLKIEQKISKVRAAEPGRQAAWDYVTAYFNGAQEAGFGVVDRHWFEDRLRTHFNAPTVSDDGPWYTLRNVIYAYGCRIRMAKEVSFFVARQMSWPWFENALSTFPDLVFMRSSLVGVQALVVMAVEDDEITCHLPPRNPPSPDRVEKMQYFEIMIKLSQLSAKIGKRLTSGNALRQTPEETMQTVSSLDAEVDAFKASTQDVLDLDNPIDFTKLPPGMSLTQTLTTQFTYFGLMLSLHTLLAFPWYLSKTKLNQNHSFQDQAAKSASVATKVAREVIVITRLVPLDANCSVLLAIYVPMYAVITLFVRLLSDPTSPSASSDLVTLEIAAGHFARLTLATGGQIAMPFASDLARFAKAAIDRANLDEGNLVGSLEPSMDWNLASSLEHSVNSLPSGLDAINGRPGQIFGLQKSAEFLDYFDPTLGDGSNMDMWDIMWDDTYPPG